MRMGRWAVLWLGLSGCALEVTPYEECVAADDGCCKNRECGSDAICDYDYICTPRVDGGLDCSDPIGDQTCHMTCRSNADCTGGQQCIEMEQTQGPNDTSTLYACF